MQEIKNPATKLVEVRLSALTRVEYMEVVEVPVDMTASQINELVNRRYEKIDGGEYINDPEYWERGTCYTVDTDMPGVEPSLRAVIGADGLDVVPISDTE